MVSENLNAAFVNCKTPDEFRELLLRDVRNCMTKVAKGRALINVLEQLYPVAQPKGDRGFERLYWYGVHAKWSWSSERAMALDLAELVEDMEAARQREDGVALQYRAALVRLVGAKLDMDRGREILGMLDQSEGEERVEIFHGLRNGTQIGWARGLERVKRELEILGGDSLIFYKGYANMELGKERFTRPSSPTSDTPRMGDIDWLPWDASI